MDVRCIFFHGHVRAFQPRKTHLRDGRRAVSQQPGLEVRIGPGPGHYLGTHVGADFVLVVIDDGIQGSLIHQTFFGQQGFQRLYPQLHIR